VDLGGIGWGGQKVKNIIRFKPGGKIHGTPENKDTPADQAGRGRHGERGEKISIPRLCRRSRRERTGLDRSAGRVPSWVPRDLGERGKRGEGTISWSQDPSRIKENRDGSTKKGATGNFRVGLKRPTIGGDKREQMSQKDEENLFRPHHRFRVKTKKKIWYE